MCRRGNIDCYVLLHFCSSDVGQREQEKARLEKLYQESDRRLDNLIQGPVYLSRMALVHLLSTCSCWLCLNFIFVVS